MEKTANLGLNKPLQTEFYDVDDFNENADILDSELNNCVHKTDDESIAGNKTFNGNIVSGTGDIRKNRNDSSLSVFGGSNQAGGSSLSLSGRDAGGSFKLDAYDGEFRKSLTGNTSGTLTWNDSEVLTASGTETITGAKTFDAEQTFLKKAVLSYGSNTMSKASLYTSTSVANTIRFKNELVDDAGLSLTLPASGWKSIVTSINGTTADSTGNVVVSGVPVGSLIAMAVSTTPAGYLPCNGQAIPRTTYASLFAVIGTTYGAGDGSSTFNLPLINDGKFLRGSTTAGATHGAGLPNITGTAGIVLYPINSATTANYQGAFSDTTLHTRSTTMIYGNSNQNPLFSVDFKASNSNSIYGGSDTVMPKSLDITYFIKY